MAYGMVAMNHVIGTLLDISDILPIEVKRPINELTYRMWEQEAMD